MRPEKLTRKAVVEQALKLADAEGLETVTIRRLARQLGVTPMALYWHFKNKDLLLVAMLDAIFGEVPVELDPAEPWQRRLRVMVEALVRVLRRHRWTPDLYRTTHKARSTGFARTTDVALGILSEAGFPLGQSHQIASYLLHGVTSLVAADPSAPVCLVGTEEITDWRRRWQREMEENAEGHAFLSAYVRTLDTEPDVDGYYAFGIDLLLAGVVTLAPAGH